MEIINSYYNWEMYLFSMLVLCALLVVANFDKTTKKLNRFLSILILLTMIICNYLTFIYHGKSYHTVKFESYDTLYEQSEYEIINVDKNNKTAKVKEK